MRNMLCGMAAMPLLMVLGMAPALADDCARVRDALVKSIRTPNHKFATIDGKGVATGHPVGPMMTESIYTGDATYEKKDGAWVKTEDDLDKAEANIRGGTENFDDVCEAAGSETMGGETADVIKTHTKAKNGALTAEKTTWISQTSGLILKDEAEAVTSVLVFHVVSTYDYKDVHAPETAP